MEPALGFPRVHGAYFRGRAVRSTVLDLARVRSGPTCVRRLPHLGIAQGVPNAENRHIRLVTQPVPCYERRARWRRGRRNSASRPTRCLPSSDLPATRSAHWGATRWC